MGPFEILEQINLQSYKLQLLRDMRVHPVFHVLVLEPYSLNTITGRTPPPLPPVGPVTEDSSAEWEVEEILSSQ